MYMHVHMYMYMYSVRAFTQVYAQIYMYLKECQRIHVYKDLNEQFLP